MSNKCNRCGVEDATHEVVADGTKLCPDCAIPARTMLGANAVQPILMEVVSASSAGKADIFFDRPFCTTDWAEVRRKIETGILKSGDILAEIKALEPMAQEDYRDFEHWRKQQILRLCLLHEAGKKMELTTICEDCGKNHNDPVHGERNRYCHQCLACAEISQQLYQGGSRGSMRYVRPTYNHLSKSWGILYYWSGGRHDHTFMLWLADYYKTRLDAVMALQPIKHFTDWINTRNNGLITHWIDFGSFFGIEAVMQMKTPLSPEQFRATLRSRLEEMMTEEQELLSYSIRDVIRDHERAEND